MFEHVDIWLIQSPEFRMELPVWLNNGGLRESSGNLVWKQLTSHYIFSLVPLVAQKLHTAALRLLKLVYRPRDTNNYK